MQAGGAGKLDRIVVRAEPLVHVIEQDRAVRPQVDCDDVGQETGVVRKSYSSVRENRAESTDDNTAVTERPGPKSALACLPLVGQGQHEALVGDSDRPGLRLVVGQCNYLMHTVEIRVLTIWNQRFAPWLWIVQRQAHD